MDLDALQAQLAKLISELSGDVTAALAFLNTVVLNNPDRSRAEIEARPDVQEALQDILEWLNGVEEFASQLPATMTPDRVAVAGTLAKARTDLTRNYFWESIPRTNQLRLRLGWLMGWLLFPLQLLAAIATGNSQWKTWMSRLAPNTCSTCAALHGTTIDINASFAPYARAAGWTHIYGSLLTPPLHPHCLCWLVYT